jgi:hypothetical protein
MDFYGHIQRLELTDFTTFTGMILNITGVQGFSCCWASSMPSTSSSLLGLLDCEHEGATILWNVRNYEPNNLALRPRRLESSSVWLWERQILPYTYLALNFIFQYSWWTLTAVGVSSYQRRCFSTSVVRDCCTSASEHRTNFISLWSVMR